MKADTICCCWVSKQESLHVQARLTVCEVGVFSREISQLLQICPPPSFRTHLSSSPMGVVSKDVKLNFTSRNIKP